MRERYAPAEFQAVLVRQVFAVPILAQRGRCGRGLVRRRLAERVRETGEGTRPQHSN